VLRRIFGHRLEEVAGSWRRLHNEKLRYLYASPSIIRMIKARMLRWMGHVAGMGGMRNAYIVVVGKPEGKRSPGRPRRRWEDVRISVREIGLSMCFIVF
jgi:hypothetical protein